jgi:hypothetical protein
LNELFAYRWVAFAVAVLFMSLIKASSPPLAGGCVSDGGSVGRKLAFATLPDGGDLPDNGRHYRELLPMVMVSAGAWGGGARCWSL